MDSISIPDLIIGGSLLYFGNRRKKGGLKTVMMIGGVLGIASAFARKSSSQDGATYIVEGRPASVGAVVDVAQKTSFAELLNPGG